MSLPYFLKPFPSKSSQATTYLSAIFPHKNAFHTHALWWPPKNELSTDPKTVILFIPGNPGLLEFYTPFLSFIHEQGVSSNVAILAHSHIGHTPRMNDEVPSEQWPLLHWGLTAQVESALEAFDTIRFAFGLETKIVVIGHSVGSWISLKILKARPNFVSGVFLLFPTISQIGKTPNGRRYSLVGIFSKAKPDDIIPVLHNKILVLRTLLHSPTSIHAALHMANDEMKAIGDLDVGLLSEHRHRLWFYLAEHDDWVGDQKGQLLRFLNSLVDFQTMRMVIGDQDIPHAFCISHGERLATQCHQWLQSFCD